MAAVQISTNVEFLQINTTTNAGRILLPSTTAIAGRILTIKDTTGTFQRNPLTLSTNGADRFEAGDNLKQLVEPYGFLTLASDGANRWFFLDGTSLNSYTFSTLTNRLQTSTFTMSTQQTTLSTLAIFDRSFQTPSTLLTRSTVMFLGSNAIAGTKAGPWQFLQIRSPFQPSQISGLSIWLDAADPATTTVRNASLATGAPIAQWRDKSANGLILNQANPANMPTIAPAFLNGNNVIGFTTVQSMTSLTNFTLGQSQTFFVVFNPVTTTNYFFIEQGTNAPTTPGSYLYGANNNLFSIRDTLGVFRNAFDSQAGLAVAPFATVNTWYFCSYVNSNVALQAVNDLYWSINGSQRTMGFNVWNNITSGNTTAGLNVNVRNSASNYYGEILIYNAALTLAQVRQVEGYLAWKWGLVGNLPASHPFKNAPP